MAYILTKDMTREQWLEHRYAGIGGSDASAALGFNRYKTRIKLWMEKTRQVEPDVIETESMETGILLEPVISTLFTRRTGYKVMNDNKIRIHPEYEYLIGDLDRIVPRQAGIDHPRALELKSTSAWNIEEWDQEEMPINHFAQIQHYLLVTGYKQGFVAVLAGGNKFRWVPVLYDEEYLSMALEQYKTFWDCVTNMKSPAPQTAEETVMLFPRSVDSELALTEDNYLTVLKAKKYWYAAKKAQEEYDILKDQLASLMQTYSVATFAGQKVMTFKTNKDKEILELTELETNEPKLWAAFCTIFDEKAFKEAHPDIAAKYTKSVPGNRPFTIPNKLISPDDVTLIVE